MDNPFADRRDRDWADGKFRNSAQLRFGGPADSKRRQRPGRDRDQRWLDPIQSQFHLDGVLRSVHMPQIVGKNWLFKVDNDVLSGVITPVRPIALQADDGRIAVAENTNIDIARELSRRCRQAEAWHAPRLP